MTMDIFWTLLVLLIVSMGIRAAGGDTASTVSSGGNLCRVSGKREVTCLQSNNGGPLTRLLTLTSEFELVPSTTQMKIFKDSLFLSRNLKLIIQPLTPGGVKGTITLAYPTYSFIESSTGVAILCRDGNRAKVQWAGHNLLTGEWDFSSQPSDFAGSATLFSDATSNVAMFMSAWDDIYVVRSVGESNSSPSLKFTGVWNAVVYSAPAAQLQGCAGATEIVDSPQNDLLLFHCRGRLFAYDYNEASWIDTQGVSNLKIASLIFHPKGKFLAGLLTSNSNMKPSQLVFMNFQWQTSFISLRKTSLKEGLFSEEGDLFCFTENKVSGLTCYNVSMLLSEQGFESPTMQTFSLPDSQSSLIGSVRRQMIVEYSTTEEPGRVAYAALPKSKTPAATIVELDRNAVCSEMKSALPTLAKLFC